MTIHGVANCWVDGRGIDPPVQIHTSAITGPWEGSEIFPLSTTFFVSLYKFLISPEAISAGILRRACNKGTSNTLTAQYGAAAGMDYWDTTQAIGNHAWALFEFTNANPQFFLLMQLGFPIAVANNAFGGNGYFDQNSFGQSPGAPARMIIPYTPTQLYVGQATEQTKYGGVGISIACKTDGTSPWMGSTLNNEGDTKGSPVWSPSALVWPRPNNETGVSGSLKDQMTGVYYDTNVYKPIRNPVLGGPQMNVVAINPGGDIYDVSRFDNHDTTFHMIVDVDKVAVIVDHMNIGNTSFFYFGPYKPYDASITIPYVNVYKNLMNLDTGDVLTANNQQVYGSRDFGFNTTAGEDQPINSTALHHGGVVDPVNFHVAGCSLYRPTTLASNPLLLRGENSFLPQPVRSWDFYNPVVCLNEYPNRRALLGEIEFFKFVSNIRSGVTFGSQNYATFGPTPRNQTKVAVPWPSGIVPGMSTTRAGVIF